MKILIIKTSSMGDVIHALPALTDAGKALGDMHFDWVVEEGFAEIPSWHGLVDEVIPVAWRRWRKNLWAAYKSGECQIFFKKLKDKNYDFVIDAQGLVKSAVLTRLSKGVRCGLDSDSARESLAACAYQKKYAVAKDQHAVTRIRQLFASALGYALPETVPDYGIDTSRLPNYPLDAASILFIHATSRAEKYWPEADWIALGKLVNQAGLAIQLPWGSEPERQRAERIAAGCDNAKVLPRLRLSELASLLSQAKGAIAVDTGLGHLAAALNVPAVSLYGPTDIKKIGTYGKNQQHLQMQNLAVKEVWQTLSSLFNN